MESRDNILQTFPTVKMKIAYSCVVDGSPKFEWQAVNLCTSLIHNAGVMPEDIKVHVTPSVSPAFCDFVADHGMSLVQISPFPGDIGCCNKIQQMFSPAFNGYARVVLCDCDLYFVRSLEVESIEAPAAGRVVDRPNPPYPLLQGLFEARQFATPPATEVGFPMIEGERTIAANWNGGLYVFDSAQLDRWGSVWAANVMQLLANLGELGPYQNHIDQIGWALTLEQLQIPFKHLTDTHNYPVHFSANALYHSAPPNISSFHYHHCMDALGRIQLTGIANLDVQIEAANARNAKILAARLIRNETLFHLFQRWQDFCSPGSADALSIALAAFQNQRYTRHNARRLEHLASLNLDIDCKSVLEFGAGIGDHSLFFLDRGCHVTSIEPRVENVASILRRVTEDAAFPRYRHRVIRCDVGESAAFLAEARFQIVYNYGLLYHVGEPEAFLRQSAAYCEGLYLLETAVRDLIDTDVTYLEDNTDLTNSINGACHLLSRREIFDILQQCLPFVYMPINQPAHEQFLKDWSVPPKSRLSRHRAVFIASVTPLDNTLLTDRVLDRHVG